MSLTPQEKLARTVLIQAVQDAVSFVVYAKRGRSITHYATKRDAVFFINASTQKWAESLDYWCALASITPDAVRTLFHHTL